jgi:sugar lactone lactonase YvrE
MPDHRIFSQSILRRLPRILGQLAAGVALLALPSQAWGIYNFTVSNNTFPASGAPPAVGSSIHQTVYVTLNGSAMAIKSIVLQSAGATVGTVAEYKLGTITGCTVDPTGVTTNPGGTVCSIPVTYTPAYPGSLASPALSRNATLVLTDNNDSKTWTFTLTGAATGPLTQLVPGTLIRYAGAAYTTTGINPLDYGLGSTTGAYSGDTGQAANAKFNFSSAYQTQTQLMAYDSAGNLYVIDANNYIIRKIDNTTNHDVTTIAGTPQTSGYAGDGGLATNAKLVYPYALTLDAAGDIYFMDETSTSGGYLRLRRIDAVSGLITPVAGQNFSGSYNTASGGGTCNLGSSPQTCGDTGLATYADLHNASNMAIDPAGNIYLWDQTNAIIREITAADGKINTIATAAQLNSAPVGSCAGGGGGGMTLGSDGNLYVATVNCTLNSGNGALVIEEYNITNSPGTVTTVAGGTWQSNYCTFTSAQGGFPAADLFIEPSSGQTADLASDASGNLYLSAPSEISGCIFAGYPSIYRINLATQTAYLMADGMDASLNGTATNVAFNAFYGYAFSPYTAIPDPAGNLFVMTYNQIAEINGSSAALYMPSGSSNLQDFSTSADQIITYANVGNASETAPHYSFASTDSTAGTNFGTDPSPTIPTPAGNAADCTTASSVAVNAACTFYLQFTPTQVGALADTLDLGIPIAQSVSLSGNGLAYPQIGLNTTALSFGNVTQNTSAIQYVTITNTGTATLTVNNLFSNGTNASNFVVAAGGTSPCTITSNTITLTAGSFCTIKVTFTPTAVASYSAYLEGAPNTTSSSSTLLALSQSKLIPLTGAGTSGVTLSVVTATTTNPSNFEAYQNAYSANQDWVITNAGPNAISSISINITGTNASMFSNTVNHCSSLAVGKACNLFLQFAPSSATPNNYTATLTAQYTDGGDNATHSASATLTGVVLPLPTSSGSPQLSFIPSMTTFAGSGTPGAITSGPATSAGLRYPLDVQPDNKGDVYIADTGNNLIEKVDSTGKLTIVAGTGSYGYSADNVLATTSELAGPGGIALDSAGNLFIADTGNARIRRVDATTQMITTVAGTGLSGFTGDGGLASAAKIGEPYSIAFDSHGNLYFSDWSQFDVRVITANGSGLIDSSSTINSYAGLGGGALVVPSPGFSGDGGPAISAQLFYPYYLAFDASNNLFIADYDNSRVRRVDATTHKISTVAGFGGEGGGGLADVTASTRGLSPLVAELTPVGVAVDATGNLYISDFDGPLFEVNETTAPGIINWYPSSSTSFNVPAGLRFDNSGDLYVADQYNNKIRMIAAQGALNFGSVNVGSTSGAQFLTIQNNGSGPLAFAATPYTVTGNFTVGSSGTCSFTAPLAIGANCTVAVTFSPLSPGPLTGTISFASNDPNSPLVAHVSGTGVGVALTSQTINFPTIPAQTVGTPLTLSASATSGLTVTFSSTTADTGICSVSGTQATFSAAGTCTIDANQAGNSTYSAAPMVPQSFTVNAAPPTAPAVSISPSSYVFPATTVESGYQSGNGNPAITLTNIGNAPLIFTGSKPFTIIGPASSPISVYPNGSCTETYVDFSTSLPAGNNCTIAVQFWPQAAGVYAATLSVADNAANSPQTIPLSGIGKAGQLQFAPAQLNAFAGAIGNANACADTGNDSAATSAQLCTPNATATDMSGNIYIADPGKNVVRMVNSAGIIGNFAGGSLAQPCVATSSSIGDGCAAINATLNNPTAVAVDGFGNVYISDTGNARVRVVNAVTGIISTYAGNGSTGTFAAGTATSVPIVPNGIAFDPSGNLYIADAAQDIVIEVNGTNGNASVIAGIVGQPSHLNAPMGVAVDLNGDVYIADTGNNFVRELVNTGDGYTNTIFAGTGTGGNTGDNGPATSAEIYANGVAVDAAGDVYISSRTSIRMVNLTGTITTLAGGGSGSTLPAQAIGVGLSSIGLPGIDLAGDVLIPSGTGVAMAGPQGDLVFGSTNVGSTSTAQIVTITNTGNSSVYFYNPNEEDSIPGTPGRAAATAGARSGTAVAEGTSSSGNVWTVTGDFAIASGGTCNLTTSGSIASGASCTINVTFSPTQTGVRTGNITLYADGLYNIPAVVNLSGTGTSAALIAQIINFTQPTTPVTYASGLAIPLVATGGASGNSIVFSIDASSTGTGSITGATLNVTGVGTFVIDANQAGNATYAAATQVQKSVVVTQAAQVINFTQPTTPVTYSSGLTIPLVATGGASGNSIVFSIDTSSTGAGSITGATLNVTGVGTFVIDANQAGNANYAAATQVQKSVVVTTPPPPSFAVVSPTPTQIVQPGGAAQYTINVNPVNGSYTGAVTLSAVQNTLPTGATASFSLNPVTPGSAGATSMLTIQTAAQTAAAKSSSWPLAAPALALIGLFFVPGKRRRRWLTLGVLLLGSLGALTALSGCGGGFWLSTSKGYTVTVNGANTSGVVVSTTTVQLTVQ